MFIELFMFNVFYWVSFCHLLFLKNWSISSKLSNLCVDFIGSVPGHLLCFCRDYSDFLHFIPIILFLFLLICVFSFFLCQLVRGLLILLISFKIQVFCFIGSSVFSFLTSLNSAIIFTISFPLLALCLFCSYFSSFLR